MKKTFLALLLLLGFFVTDVFAVAGTVTLAQDQLFNANGYTTMRVVSFVCVGDSTDGTIPDTAINADNLVLGNLAGWFLYRMVVENDAGDTGVTDDSDVYIKDAGGSDLLNGQGVDQLDDDTRNYIRLCRHDPVSGTLTLDVDNQDVHSGEYTITLILAK